ncbi:MAG: TlpA family protein disulfide reductase [Candidatus Coatesbacteria bacterium]|nr:TlpA family protein disulfide reductase [Candidatus Coatesbacteria bacterium]
MRAKLLGFVALGLVVVMPVFAFGAPAVGDEALNFTVQSLGENGQGGDRVSLSDHAGQIVVIDFWMYNCGPCHAAVPVLESDVWQVYKDRGVLVWGIDVDPTRDTFETIQAFKDMYGLTYPLALDVNGGAWSKYSSGYVPTMYIIDADGIVQFQEVGFHEDEVIAKIEELLSQEPAGPTFALRLNKMDMTPYAPGDIMTLYADVSNPGEPMAVDIYIAVELFGQYYFWPTYEPIMTPFSFVLPVHMAVTGYVLESVMFDNTFPQGTFKWLGVLANPVNGQWETDLSVVTWTFGLETP